MNESRTIEQYHATRESGSGCPETNGGAHYFAHIDPTVDGRICIDCGSPEPADPEHAAPESKPDQAGTTGTENHEDGSTT